MEIQWKILVAIPKYMPKIRHSDNWN